MKTPFEIKGRRGVLNLYFEGDDLAIDLTEYAETTGSGFRVGLPKSVEMFVAHGQIGELIEGLRNMRDEMNERKNRRAHEAALQLTKGGVSPRDSAEVTPEELRHNPDLMESVALFYLNEAQDARTPEYPF